MRRSLLDVLACPGCRGQLRASSQAEEIVEGSLTCEPCGQSWAISRGIPRFASAGNYASSFGLQWNTFRGEQLDSLNGTDLSARRFYSETAWDRGWMRNKWILDAGCGAGRFLDVASGSEGNIVGVDLSNAVDAAAESLRGRPNVHLVQASLFELPFRRCFDGVYCIGVIQHTPDPQRALAALPQVLKSGGQLAVTIYEKRRFSKLYSKYWLRPWTHRMDKQRLLQTIRLGMPLLFPLTELLFRVPVLGKLFRFTIPVANYTNQRQLSIAQRYKWAVLDTFDMLSPEFDAPQEESVVRQVLSRAGITKLRRLPTGGLNLIGERA